MATRATAADLAETLRRDGYVVVPELISQSEVDEIKTSLAPWLRGERMGRG